MVEKAAKSRGSGQLFKSPIIWAILAVGLGIFILKDPVRFKNILVVLASFGAIIFVHELGHFAAAKSVGIFVEAFAIGFGPVLVGIKRVQGGFAVSILPRFIHDHEGESTLGFVSPWSGAQAGQTACTGCI